MALFSSGLPKKFKWPIAVARNVCLVKAVETSEAGKKYWSAADAAKLTEDMKREAQADSPQVFAEKRAALGWSRMTQAHASLRAMKFTYGLGFLVPLALIAAAFILGAFAERFTSAGSVINLFSPVFLFIVIWSLVVYAALLVLGLLGTLRRKHMEFPFRSTLAKISDGLFSPRWITSDIRRAFMQVWAPIMLRISQAKIARALHWAFLAFVAGALANLFMRGMNTSFLVGWDLPGLNNSPEKVAAIFQLLWGWLPQGLGLPALPGADGIAAMRLDRLALSPDPSLSAASAWIPRILVLLICVVLIPRLLLILWDTLVIRYLSGHVAVPCDEYFQKIFASPDKAEPLGAAPAAQSPEAAPGEQTQSQAQGQPQDQGKPDEAG